MTTRGLAAWLASAALIGALAGGGVVLPARALASEARPKPESLELHAHLFMKEGMGLFFRGDFFGPLRARSWKDKLSSQANPESVNASGIRVLVGTIYANPVLTLSLRDSVRRQIAQARKFVSENPEWVIARNAGEARAALAQNKRVLILALEGASGILEREEDYREFIDDGGIRIVTLLHLTDDHFGGVAYLQGLKVLSNPFSWITGIFSDPREDGIRLNRHGLEEHGREQLAALLQRGVWIDLPHSSDESLRAIVPALEARGQPLLLTHTALRDYHRAERGVPAWLLERVHASGGVVGLVPSPEFLEGTPGPGGVCALARQYTETAAKLGDARAVSLGSDFNGAIPHLKPGAELDPPCITGTALDREGMANIGQSHEVWRALRALKAPVPERMEDIIERFLSAWERVR